MTSKSEVLKSTSLKKRAFDERSEAPPSFRASKRRNVGNRELDICEMRTKSMQNSNGALEKLKRKKAYSDGNLMHKKIPFKNILKIIIIIILYTVLYLWN